MSSDPEPNNPPATSSSLNSVVTLNVGGTRFETTRQTLLTDPNSMLAKMFDPVSPLQPGKCLFDDRHNLNTIILQV